MKCVYSVATYLEFIENTGQRGVREDTILRVQILIILRSPVLICEISTLGLFICFMLDMNTPHDSNNTKQYSLYGFFDVLKEWV